MAEIQFDDQVDITDKVCPLTFVKAKVAIEELDDGEVLAIRMNDGEPVQNVPRSMKEEGHTIGLHSFEHKNALIKGPLYTNKDFKESSKIMKELDIDIKSFRPPWGHLNLMTLFNIRKYDFKLVLWDVIIGDWKSDITADEISRRLLKESKNKNVICLHDGRGSNGAPARTIVALDKTIPIWLEEGFKFLNVGELYE